MPASLSTRAAKEFMVRNKWVLLFAVLYSSAIFYLAPVELPIVDSGVYADLANNLAKGHGYASNFVVDARDPPGYPVYLAVSMLLFGDFFMKASLALVSFLLILAMFWLTLEITGRRNVAYASSFFLVATPLVIYNEMRILSDVPFLLLLILSFFTYIRFLKKKKSTLNVALWGVFTGLAILTRYTGLLLILIFLAHAAYLKLTSRKRKAAFGYKHMVLFLLTVLLVVSPWVAWRAYNGYFHELLYADRTVNSTNIGHIEMKIEALSSSTGDPLNANAISIDTYVPVQLVNFIRACASIILFITPLVSAVFIYKLYLYFFRGKRKKYDGLLMLWFFTFFIFHSLYPGSLDSRYMLSLAPPLVIFFSEFIADNWKGRKNIIILLIVIQMASAALVVNWDYHARWQKAQTEVFRDTGLWLKANAATDAKVMAIGYPSPTISFFGERKVIEFGSEAAPDYVVISDFFSPDITIDRVSEKYGKNYVLLKEFHDVKYRSDIYGAA